MNDIEKLSQLIQWYLDGKPLPDVEGLPAVEWLEFLRSDRTPFFNTGLASRLDMMSNSPWVSEVAATLRARLQAL